MGVKYWLMLCFALILITIPRFDKQDLWIIGKFTYQPDKIIGQTEIKNEKFSDDMSYTDIVEYYRTGVNQKHYSAPYVYRPFVTYVASYLPFRAITSINIVNLTFVILTMFFLRGILLHLNFTDKEAFFACVIYVFSFQTFYYSTTGLIDPTITGWFTICVYLALKNKLYLLLVAFIFAALTKESAILLLPIVFIIIFQNNNMNKAISYSMLYLIIFLIVMYFVRQVQAAESGHFWFPSMYYFNYNILHPKAWISTLLTLGIPGFLTIPGIFVTIKKYAIIKNRFLPFVVGIISFFLFMVYGLFTIRIGGTYYLPMIVCTLPLAMSFLKHKMFPKLVFGK